MKKKPETPLQKIRKGNWTPEKVKAPIKQAPVKGWTRSTPVEPKKVPTVLEEAQSLVYGDRAASYGKAIDNFTNTAAGWAVILGVPITPEQVGLMMAWLKIARQVHKPQRDNLVDCAGYIATVEKCQKGE